MSPSTRPLAAACAAAFVLAGCERPPVDTIQRGYRGTGMVHVENPRIEARKWAENQSPAASPAVPADGPRAREVFKNLAVLGDVSVAQFTRLMADMTQWVAPVQGCAYCHEGGDFAADGLYTKRVARRMLEMTRSLNADWKVHTGATGVTCFTCHRGENVPASIWHPAGPDPRANRLTGARDGLTQVGLMSLSRDPLERHLHAAGPIPVIGHEALPTGKGASIQDTESTYALMIHVSRSLGVNCTFCHNSRSFFSWEASSPLRTTAWHGIRMVRDLNANYLAPLAGTLPPVRLGEGGTAPMVSCETCHHGVNKPLYGASLAKDYPELTAAAK